MTQVDRDRSSPRPGLEPGSDGEPDPDPQDVRALTEYLTVLEDLGNARGADGLYLVVSGSGREYLVDARTGVCECPDHRYRGVRCKHARRVAFVTGERAIPAGVDERLGDHVDATPRVAVTDGGEVLGESANDQCGAEPDGTDPGSADRPDDCACWDPEGALPCWPCYRDGFEDANPETPGAEKR